MTLMSYQDHRRSLSNEFLQNQGEERLLCMQAGFLRMGRQLLEDQVRRVGTEMAPLLYQNDSMGKMNRQLKAQLR